MILNRGPHGPPRGEFTSLGGGGGEGYRAFGELGRNGPLWGESTTIAINSPGCSSGWRIVAASPVPSAQRITTGTGHFGHSAQTKMDTGPMKDNIFGSETFILLTKMEMHYRRNEFQNFLQNLALDGHDGLHRKSTLAFIRHCSRVGGNDKLAIDKGGEFT